MTSPQELYHFIWSDSVWSPVHPWLPLSSLPPGPPGQFPCPSVDGSRPSPLSSPFPVLNLSFCSYSTCLGWPYLIPVPFLWVCHRFALCPWVAGACHEELAQPGLNHDNLSPSERWIITIALASPRRAYWGRLFWNNEYGNLESIINCKQSFNSLVPKIHTRLSHNLSLVFFIVRYVNKAGKAFVPWCLLRFAH